MPAVYSWAAVPVSVPVVVEVVLVRPAEVC